MEINDLKGKLVAVLGYGKEGKATAAYLMGHGVTPVLFDERPWDEWEDTEKLEIKKLGVNFIFGPDAFKELAGFDVVFRSPGIQLSKLTTYNLQLTSQTKWFFEHCPAKIIGVTGTKGKGTTATLISEILKLQCQMSNVKCQTYLTGNIGKTQPFEILDGLAANDWVVYELSSFQLQDLTQSPHIAVVLMVTSEHLDYHRDLGEYVSAKSAITKFQAADDFAVINADFPSSIEIGKQSPGRKKYFSTRVPADCYVAADKIACPKSNIEYPIPNLQLRGRHNLQNVCAAVLAADAAGVKQEIIKQGITDFKGLEHRLEFVAEKNGIKFYNDSFSTTPETAIAAIQSFTEPLVVILGGSSKNSDFTELGQTIIAAKNIKALILAGEEGSRIKMAVDGAGTVPARVLTGAKTMAGIFAQASSVAQKGDVVLLSPACASFDMFTSYTDRGNQFKKFVNSL